MNGDTTVAEPTATATAADGRRVVRAAVVWVPRSRGRPGRRGRRRPRSLRGCAGRPRAGRDRLVVPADHRRPGPGRLRRHPPPVRRGGPLRLVGCRAGRRPVRARPSRAPRLRHHDGSTDGAALRVGAWPAVAAAIVAHLLYLLATHTADALTSKACVQSAPFRPAGVQPAATTVQPELVQPALVEPVQPAGPTGVQPARPRSALTTTSDDQRVRRSGPSPARDRAQAPAARYAHRHGRLPTVSELATAADVPRGTAGTALTALRQLTGRSAPEHPTPQPRTTTMINNRSRATTILTMQQFGSPDWLDSRGHSSRELDRSPIRALSMKLSMN
jgi:hypothetical protein